MFGIAAIINTYTNPTVSASVTMTTTSSFGSWQPIAISKSGDTLIWKAEGAGITTQEINANQPTFDFSANTSNLPINITITSDDNLAGFTELDLWVGAASLVNTLDISAAVDMEDLNIRYCVIQDLDLSALTKLRIFVARGNTQLAGTYVPPPAGAPMIQYWMDVVDYNAALVDLSTWPTLTDARMYDIVGGVFDLNPTRDQWVIDLDANGALNGNLQLTPDNPTPELSEAAASAYAGLLAKGWTIDIAEPYAYPGDLYGATQAYSLDRLYPSATIALSVERTSDSAQTDVYFNRFRGVNGSSLVAAGGTLDDWAGTDTVYVWKWWDQSGAGKDLVGVGVTNYPKLYVAGVLQADNNGNVGLLFELSDALEIAANTYKPTAGMITYAISRNTLDQQVMFRGDTNSEYLFVNSSGSTSVVHSSPNGDTSGLAEIFVNSRNAVHPYTRDELDSYLTRYETQIVSGTNLDLTTGWDRLELGGYESSGFDIEGIVSEVQFYNTTPSETQRHLIESEMNSRIGAYAEPGYANLEDLTYDALTYDAVADITTQTHANFSGKRGQPIIGSTTLYVQYTGTQTDFNDISTLSTLTSGDSNAFGLTTQSAFWNSTGTRLVTISNGSFIRGTVASTPYLLSSLSGTNTNRDLSGDGVVETRALALRNGYVYLIDQDSDILYQYEWTGDEGDVTFLSLVGSISIVANGGTNYQGIDISPDGKTMLIMNTGTDVVNEWALSTPWMITTATYVQENTFTNTCCGSVIFNNLTYSRNYNKLLLTAGNTEVLHQFDLGNTYGDQLLLNPRFIYGGQDWSLSTNSVVDSNGLMHILSATGDYEAISQNIGVVAGDKYYYEIDIVELTGTLQINCGDTYEVGNSVNFTAPGRYTGLITAGAGAIANLFIKRQAAAMEARIRTIRIYKKQ